LTFSGLLLWKAILLLLFYSNLFWFILFYYYKEPLLFVSRKCDIALSVPRPTTFYWTRRYVDRKATSFDCLTAPASCTHLAAAIARNISHCSHIESPVQYRVTCYRRSRREARCIQHASTRGNAFRGRQRASPSLSLRTHLGPYLFITRVSYENIE